jgi:zinc transporter ZupT
MISEFLGIILLIITIWAAGALVFLFEEYIGKRLIKNSLAFSGGFLVSIAFLHFIPELYHDHGNVGMNMGIWIMVGFLIQLILEYFSGGIEHGHTHSFKDNIPVALFISLSIHAIIEGIPMDPEFHNLMDFNKPNLEHIHQEHEHGHYIGISQPLLWGVILHNIPVSIALTTLLINSGWKKRKAFSILVLFSLMTPLGIALGHYNPRLFDETVIQVILAVVVGMFLHISTTIIFESTESHKFNLLKLLLIVSGAGLGYLFG